MTLKQFQNSHFSGERKCVEVKDKKMATNFFRSKTSAAWANGHVKGTGWSVVMQPSRRSQGDPLVAFVCKTELIGADTRLYLDRIKS